MSNKMTIDQAIRILDPATSKAEVEKIRASIITDDDEDRYYATIAKVDEACMVACDTMKKWKEEKIEKINKALSKPCTICPIFRSRQYNDDGETIKTYLTPEGVNPYPCTCGSDCFHYEIEYDFKHGKPQKKMHGVCNSCQKDIYQVPSEKIDEILKTGVWKPFPIE